MGHRSRPVGLLVIVSLLLLAAGNLLSNAVTVPAAWKPWAPPLLALVTLSAMVVDLRLAALQGAGGGRWTPAPSVAPCG